MFFCSPYCLPLACTTPFLCTRLPRSITRRPSPPAAAVKTRAQLARHATTLTTACILGGIVISAGFLFSIIRPIRRTAAAARRIGQGELQQRIEWRTRDDLGTIATELNRMAVRLRDLRETEFGRKQMDQQLSDAVVQSIFEPVIVTDAKGHVLKLNQAASEVLGEAAADRMALTNTPGENEFCALCATLSPCGNPSRVRTKPLCCP